VGNDWVWKIYEKKKEKEPQDYVDSGNLIRSKSSINHKRIKNI
jgi:hypothetical protein